MELTEIATQLRDAPEKIILIYAFNATGKTRLSVEYKEATRAAPVGGAEKGNQTGVYYNAFSEDLFVWDNDIENGEVDIRLKITESSLNDFHSNLDIRVLRDKLEPYNFGFYFEFEEFKDADGERNRKRGIERGIKAISFYPSDQKEKRIKISRSEERIFVWCFFLALFEIDGWSGQQNGHFLIDDPVSSLDDHNIFITASTIFDLIEKHFKRRKIIITTHHIGIYSILYDWICKGEKAGKFKDKAKKFYKFFTLSNKTGELTLESHNDDVFLYHLQLLRLLDGAKNNNALKAHHVVLLRQVLENVGSFLGVGKINYALTQIAVGNESFVANAVNFLSHKSTYQYQTDELNTKDADMVKTIIVGLLTKYQFVLHGD